MTRSGKQADQAPSRGTPAITVQPARLAEFSTPMLALALPPSPKVEGLLAALDSALGGALRRTFDRRDFRGTRDETLHLVGGASGPQRVLLVGTGSGTDRRSAIKRAAAIAGRSGQRLGVGAMAFWSADLDESLCESAALGVALGSWEYRELKAAAPPDERRAPLESAVILSDAGDGAARGAAAGEAIAAGYALTRRLGMMPGNLCTPDYLAEAARDLGQRHGLAVTVLGRREMEQEGMGSFLCVAQATAQDPKLIVLEYKGGEDGAKPIALVGKGLCFDSGGISIKPAQGMELMKFDMSGAGAVLGAMEAIARLRLPVNVVGLIGSTTNMLSGDAVKPGDVVRSKSGKTIEVINTDAEGRLVLADVLAYAKRYEPVAMLDAATLTGACVIALGNSATGVFGSDEELVQEVLAAGRRAAEPGWPMPVWDDYKELIKSDVADVKNSGGRAAGAITAALFLKEFVDSVPWVHLDIAGTAYSENDLVTVPKGPTGIPVGLFVEFVRGRMR